MDLQEVGSGYMNWIRLAQDKDGWRTLVSAVMNLRVPWNAGNFLTSCKPVSFSRRTLRHGVSMEYGGIWLTVIYRRYFSLKTLLNTDILKDVSSHSLQKWTYKFLFLYERSTWWRPVCFRPKHVVNVRMTATVINGPVRDNFVCIYSTAHNLS